MPKSRTARKPPTLPTDEERAAALAKARTFPTVNTETASLVVGCSRRELYHLIERGDLAAVMAGKNWKVSSASLLRLVKVDV